MLHGSSRMKADLVLLRGVTVCLQYAKVRARDMLHSVLDSCGLESTLLLLDFVSGSIPCRQLLGSLLGLNSVVLTSLPS